MNADLKQQIEDVLAEWRNSDDDLFSFEETCDRMAAMLQELIDAPEAEPVAYVTGYNNGYPTIAPINSALCMAIGTALYSAPQPPKLSDERILEIYEEAKANWNAQADQCNQWSDLGVDEVVTLVARAVEREILGGAQS